MEDGDAGRGIKGEEDGRGGVVEDVGVGSDLLGFGDASLSDEVSESVAGAVEGLRGGRCVFLVSSNVCEVQAVVISNDLFVENASLRIISLKVDACILKYLSQTIIHVRKHTVLQP